MLFALDECHPLPHHQVEKNDGKLTFVFTRALAPFGYAPNTSHAIGMTPGATTPLMWALFPSWSVSNATGFRPMTDDRHFDMSDKAVDVDFAAGLAVQELTGWGLSDAQRAHGALMFLAWGLFYPISALANRHLKPRGGPLFFKAS